MSAPRLCLWLTISHPVIFNKDLSSLQKLNSEQVQQKKTPGESPRERRADGRVPDELLVSEVSERTTASVSLINLFFTLTDQWISCQLPGRFPSSGASLSRLPADLHRGQKLLNRCSPSQRSSGCSATLQPSRSPLLNFPSNTRSSSIWR